MREGAGQGGDGQGAGAERGWRAMPCSCTERHAAVGSVREGGSGVREVQGQGGDGQGAGGDGPCTHRYSSPCRRAPRRLPTRPGWWLQSRFETWRRSARQALAAITNPDPNPNPNPNPDPDRTVTLTLNPRHNPNHNYNQALADIEGISPALLEP